MRQKSLIYCKKNYKAFEASPEFIETAIMYVPEWIDEDERADALAHTRMSYYKALSQSKYFKEKLDKISADNKIDIVDVEEPRPYNAVTWSGNGESYYDEDWFTNHSNKLLVAEFASLRDENEFGPKGKSVEATADVFKNAVKISPTKFIENINDFKNATFICVCSHYFRTSGSMDSKE